MATQALEARERELAPGDGVDEEESRDGLFKRTFAPSDSRYAGDACEAYGEHVVVHR